MTIIPFILMILAVPAGAALWGIYGLTGLVGITAYALRVCHDLISACLEYTAIAKLAFIWTGLSLAATGIIYGAVKGGLSYLNAQRALNKLPVTRSGDLNVIEDENAACAFTCGILRPKVYLTRGLLKRLSYSENKAVLLHELHHKKNRDPLRFFALAFLKDALFYLPLAKEIEVRERAKKERKADDSAIYAMKEGLSLASALVKVAASGKNLSFANASFSDADPASRIKRILNKREDAQKRPPIKNAAISLVMAAFVAAALVMPAASGAQAKGACVKDHCELHDSGHDKAGLSPGCKTHCEAPKSVHKH